MAYRFGPFLYDPVSHGLLREGAEIPLTHKSRERLNGMALRGELWALDGHRYGHRCGRRTRAARCVRRKSAERRRALFFFVGAGQPAPSHSGASSPGRLPAHRSADLRPLASGRGASGFRLSGTSAAAFSMREATAFGCET